MAAVAHDPFCVPGLGKPKPEDCPNCRMIRAIRADERNRIIDNGREGMNW
jgi:hypothetical protein